MNKDAYRRHPRSINRRVGVTTSRKYRRIPTFLPGRGVRVVSLSYDDLRKRYEANQETPVIVHRALLNSKLAEYGARGDYDNPVTRILMTALNEMSTKERKTLRALIGTEMFVRDVLEIFDVQAAPADSFFDPTS